MSSKPIVIRGKLKLKGSNSTNNTKIISSVEEGKKTTNTSTSIKSSVGSSSHLTEAQKKFLKRKTDLELQTIKKLSCSTYRDRVESFNMKLSTMTEHNDIPRISAAGNG